MQSFGCLMHRIFGVIQESHWPKYTAFRKFVPIGTAYGQGLMNQKLPTQEKAILA